MRSGKSNVLFTHNVPTHSAPPTAQDQTINGCLSNSIPFCLFPTPLRNWPLLYLMSYCVGSELSFNAKGSLVALFPFYPWVSCFTTKKVIGLKKSKLTMNGCFIIGLSGFVIKASSFLGPQNLSRVEIISWKGGLWNLFLGTKRGALLLHLWISTEKIFSTNLSCKFYRQ